jgi:DNA-binding transcriptional LysR family regulator
MELRHLRYFVVIAEEQSITGAAERLWIAQPGLSQQVRSLERELGVELLYRHARGVSLTAAGELFLERARAALAASDLAAATGRELQAGVIGSVRLGVASGPAWPGTSALLQSFGRERAGVELTVLQGYAMTLWREVRAGRLDALLTPTGTATAGMKTLGIGGAEWVVLVGTGHRLAGVGPVAATELEGERIAVTGHRDSDLVDKAVNDVLTELGVTADLVPGAPWPAARAAVAANDSLTLTTAPEALPKGVIARKLLPPRTLSFELLWRDEAPSAALAGFVDAAAAQAQREPSSRPLAAAA